MEHRWVDGLTGASTGSLILSDACHAQILTESPEPELDPGPGAIPLQQPGAAAAAAAACCAARWFDAELFSLPGTVSANLTSRTLPLIKISPPPVHR